MSAPDKKRLRELLGRELAAQRDRLAQAQRTSVEGVTHEDARSEGDKDMRATEASYVARGQAMRVEALEGDYGRVLSMPVRAFAEDAPVALGAVVTIHDAEERRLFVAPAGGGTVLTLDGASFHVVTPSSPLGRALIGRSAGDVVEVTRGGAEQEIEIASVG